MLVVGLTGGIGAGKSTFASLLAERGATILDADALGREALRPGRPAWRSVVDQFGDEMLGPGMEIDRARLAAVVFENREKLAALNAIIHPVIIGSIADTLERMHDTDAVVVIDAALIVETGLSEIVDVLVAVTAPKDARRERLVTSRRMTLADINARMRAQVSDEDLVARADILVVNDGTLESLVAEADRVWRELSARS